MTAQPLSGRRIGLVTASASRLGGGVFEAVVAHADMIRHLGGQVVVAALDDAHTAADRSRLGAVEAISCNVVGPRQLGYAPDLLTSLLRANLDCLHLHGIWMWPSAAASAWAHRTGRPYLISPHGMLDRWITSRGRWKKALARIGYERRSWGAATMFHALTAGEARDIAAETGRHECVVVPNAGPDPLTTLPSFPVPTIVYIGRIHEKKNLLALLEGWHRTTRPADARLIVAGWGDDSMVAAVRSAVMAGDGTASFAGPVFGAEKVRLLSCARFVILPSHSEGLPMAILEAWSRGVPAIMTQMCNLPEGFAAGAAMECGTSPDEVALALERALALSPSKWLRMAQAALDLAGERFSPTIVAEAWGAIYSEAIGGNEKRG